jgi:hypothetical protein
MSQINSYAKSDKFNLCSAFEKFEGCAISEQTHGERVEVAGIFPSFLTSNYMYVPGHPEQTRSGEIAWGKAQVCWSLAVAPQD